MSQSRSYVIYSDEFCVNLHFLYKNEHFLAKIRRILVFECIGTIHIETKQTSPMPRLGQISAYAGMISRSHDGFNRTYSPFIALFIAPNRMPRRLRRKAFNNVGWGLMFCLWSGPPGFNSLTSVALASGLAVEYSSCFIAVMNFDLYVHCFDSSMSRSPSRGPKNLYVYMNHSRTQGEVERSQNRFKPSSNVLLTVPMRCFCCGLF